MTTVLSPWSQPHSFRTKVREFQGIEKFKISPVDGLAGDRFGRSISMSSDGNTLLIGAPGKTLNGYGGYGCVYSYERSASGWEFRQMITSDILVYGYGYDVSISGDGNTCVVAAEYARGFFIYHKVLGSWIKAYEHISGGSALQVGHTCSISKDGAVCLIGTSSSLYRQPKVLVLKRTGDAWAVTATIVSGAPNSTVETRFGEKVSLSGDGKIFTISDWNNGSVTPSGQSNYNDSYIYTYDNTVEVPVRISTLSDSLPGLGVAVELDMTGETMSSSKGVNQGVAAIYKRTGNSWSVQSSVILTNVTSCALSSDGKKAAFGAPTSSTGGSAKVTKKTDSVWSQPIEIIASDIASGDYFGSSIALNDQGTIVAVGASESDPKGASSGSVYIFE